jgi:hypothetical protein
MRDLIPAGVPETVSEGVGPSFAPVTIVEEEEPPWGTLIIAGTMANMESELPPVLELKEILKTGCSSITFGAAPLCP